MGYDDWQVEVSNRQGKLLSNLQALSCSFGKTSGNLFDARGI